MGGMEDLSRQVEEFPSSVDSLLQDRARLRRRQEEALAAGETLAAYAAQLGPEGKPAALPSPAHLSELSEPARRALDGIRAEATDVTALIDDIARRRSAVAELGQKLEGARTTRNILVAVSAAAVVILILAASC
jgi:hypothetical protein